MSEWIGMRNDHQAMITSNDERIMRLDELEQMRDEFKAEKEAKEIEEEEIGGGGEDWEE